MSRCPLCCCDVNEAGLCYPCQSEEQRGKTWCVWGRHWVISRSEPRMDRCVDCWMPRHAHSWSEYRRLKEQGVNVQPPARPVDVPVDPPREETR